MKTTLPRLSEYEKMQHVVLTASDDNIVQSIQPDGALYPVMSRFWLLQAAKFFLSPAVGERVNRPQLMHQFEQALDVNAPSGLRH